MNCRIQFHDTSLQNFEWCKLDLSSGEVIESGVSDMDQLSTVCSGSTQILAFLPQQDILLTSVQLPPRASKQQLNAIAYSVEESLAEDIDDCFFAVLPQQVDNSVPVAVINTAIMDKLVESFNQQHINISSMLPQLYLSPWSLDEDLLATICPVQNGLLVRTGQHKGLICHPDILNQVISALLLHKTPNQNKLVVYGEEISIHHDAEDLHVEQQDAINLLAQPIDTHSCINLKQKTYKSSHQWLGLLKKWQWPMVAMVLLTVVYVAGSVVDSFQKEKIYQHIISQQQVLLKQHLPDVTAGNNPKKQLIKVLSDNRGSSGKIGFLDLLHEFSRLKSDFNAVKTEKIVYQKSNLVVNLETSDLNSMESFRVRLEASNFKTDIENVNINPDKTTGRLVMRDTQ